MSERPRAPNPRMESEVPSAKQAREKAKGNYRIETRIPIRDVEDIVEARQKGRTLAQELGFSMTQCTLVATAISELARNIVLYAKSGEITLARAGDDSYSGLVIHAIDQGPGIANVQRALMSGFSSSGGLGLGLSGVRQIMDEFEVKSSPGEGTHITTTLWL